MDNSIENVLSQFDNQFEGAEVKTNSQVELPDGKYVMKVSNVEVFQAKSSGRPTFRVDLLVLDGDYKGTSVSKVYMLDAPDRFPFLKGDLLACGLLLTKISELPRQCEKIMGAVVDVQAKRNDKYINYYINGKARPSTPAKSGDVPF